MRLSASLVGVALAAIANAQRPPVPSGGLPLVLEGSMVTYSDGYVTAGNLWRPDGVAPAGGWPLVVFVHRLGDSRFADLALQQQIAGQGYAVWAYDVRGQGQAAQMNVGHPQEGTTVWGPIERYDLAEEILFAAGAGPGWNGLVDGTRVAVVGSSQGGVHAWNAAAWSGQNLTVPNRGTLTFPTILCAAANDYVAEPVHDWLRNGQLFSTWFVNLVSDDAPALFVLDQAFKNQAAAAFRAQDPDGLLAAWDLEGRPIAAALAGTTVPVLYSHAYHDLIDSPLPTLQTLQTMTSAPTRALLSTIGHNTPINTIEQGYRNAMILRWLDRWLWNVPNEVDLEVGERFVLAEVPLDSTLRDDPNYAWSRIHRGDPLLPAATTRLWFDDDGNGVPLLGTTEPQAAPPPLVVEQVIANPAFTATDYLASATNRALPQVLQDCPLAEVVLPYTVATETQIDAAVAVHLQLQPDTTTWMLAALLTVQPPGGAEVMLSSWAASSRTSTPATVQAVDFQLPPVPTVLPAGSTLRIRLRNLWLREYPQAQGLEAAPLFTPFRLELQRGGLATGSWVDVPFAPVQPAIVAETGFSLDVQTLPPMHLQVRGGAARAGRPYFIAASLGGHLPAFTFENGTVPLENDWLLGVVIGAVMLPQFQGFLGYLDTSGNGNAVMDLQAVAPLDPMFIGLRLSYAAWVFDDNTGIAGAATNPVDVFLR